MDASVAENTKETYRTGLSAFDAFRSEYGLSSVWPPPVSHVTTFIAYLSLNKKAYRTINCYLSAINFRCNALQHSDFSQNFLVRKMLEGLKRLNKPKDTRMPITEDLLLRIVNNLPNICVSLYEANLFSTAFSIAFHGFFRVGEIVLSKRWQAHQIVGIEHVKFHSRDNTEFIKIVIPYSKTDQYGQGVTIKIDETKNKVCPVQLLKTFLAQRPSTKGPLFCHFSGKPVTRYQFCAVLNKVLNFMGIDASLIRSHSFRIGAASSQFEKGVSEQEIKNLGRWRSNAYKNYIRTLD